MSDEISRFYRVPSRALHDKTALAGQPTFAEKLGYIIEAWSYMERIFRDLLSFTTGRPQEETASEIWSEISFVKKLELVATAVDQMPEQPHKTELSRLLARMKDISKIRNALIHGQYVGTGDQFGYAVVHFEPRGKGRRSYPLPDTLDDHLDQLRTLFDEMLSFILRQPNGPDRLPVTWQAPKPVETD
jgi:hypothetical protein